MERWTHLPENRRRIAWNAEEAPGCGDGTAVLRFPALRSRSPCLLYRESHSRRRFRSRRGGIRLASPISEKSPWNELYLWVGNAIVWSISCFVPNAKMTSLNKHSKNSRLAMTPEHTWEPSLERQTVVRCTWLASASRRVASPSLRPCPPFCV